MREVIHVSQEQEISAPSDQIKTGSTPRYMTLAQVGELLQLSRAASYRLQADPSFPATRVGKAVRVERQALERWLAAHTQRSRAPR